MTLQEAASAAIEAFNFGNSLTQIPADFLRVYPALETVEVRTEANNKTNAEAIAKAWAKRIQKNYTGDFGVRVPVRGELGMYQKNFYGSST